MYAGERDEQRSAAGRETVVALIALCAALAPWLVAALLPPLAQPQWYHDFADQRTLWHIPHGWNVLSNLAFVAVGLWGLRSCARGTMNFAPGSGAARLAWFVMFAGVTLLGAGSAYYHLAPSDATLLWDRLPMALAFSGLVAGTLADRAPRWGGPMLVVLIVTAIGSVVGWATSGNLGPYLAMQASYVAAALLATALIRSPYTHADWLVGAIPLYAVAIGLERFDRPIDAALGSVISGHTLKHLLAAAAVLVIGCMLELRTHRAS